MTELMLPEGDYEYEGAERPFLSPAEIQTISPIVLNGFMAALEAKKAKEEAARKKAEWDRNNDILLCAEAIGADYIEASGELPNREAMEKLYANGYIDYSPQEILESGVFNDWADFQSFAEHKQISDKDRADEKKSQILSEINSGLEDGSLPIWLAADFKRYRDSSRKTKQKSIVRLTGELVGQDELIRRYAKYMIASKLVKEDPDGHGDKPRRNQEPALRRLSIALGINVESSKVLNHSFVYEIIHSQTSLKKEDIIESNVYQKWYDILHTGDRRKYLDELLVYSKDPEYLFDRQTFQIIALGMIAVDACTDENHRPYLKKMEEKDQLITGREAVIAARKSREQRPLTLRSALTKKQMKINARAHHEAYNKWANWESEDYSSYGRWLLHVTGKDYLTGELLTQAYRLGLGPSTYRIKNNFGGYLHNFYEMVGVSSRMPRYDTKPWEYEDYLSYVKGLFDEYGEVTKSVLRVHRSNNTLKNFPSFSRIRDRVPGGLSRILDDLGLPYHNKPKDPQQLLDAVAQYAEELGRIPLTKELERFANRHTYMKHFGSVANFKSELAALLRSRYGNGFSGAGVGQDIKERLAA